MDNAGCRRGADVGDYRYPVGYEVWLVKGERVKVQQDMFSGIIVDNFAGGGGASTGIKQAIGRDVDIAINHDPAAIAMHKANHPYTQHLCESVWDVDPRQVVQGRPVALCWLSPDCKHFSKAKGGKPVEKSIRGLAWVAVRWAATVRPRVIILENVEEFKTWGPLTKDGYPDPDQKGRTFNSFVNALKRHGYKVDFRELRACDYGAPTIRKRFFMIARCDGQPIRWPEPTHADPKAGSKLHPWRTAAEIIDWSIPCPSIFGRKKPLVENTMRRIARGIQKFIVENPEPYIVNQSAAFISQYHSYKSDGARGQVLDRPLLTLDTSNRYALVSAFIDRQFSKSTGNAVTAPLGTITAGGGGGKSALVKAFLTAYYSTSIGSKLTDPLPTVVSKDRFGLIVVGGLNYQITDIGYRMLTPRELFNAQGFPDDYIIDRDYTGKTYPKSAQVARCGNAVPPAFAEALVRANMPELCVIAA